MLIISYDPLHNHWKMCFWQRMLWIYKTLVSFSPGPTQVIFQGSLESHTPICCLVANLCLTETPWTGAHQAPLSMGFPRQEYWNGLPFLSPGALPDPEIEPGSLVLQADLYHLSDQRRPTDSEWSEVAQSCPTLRDPMDCSLPGSSVHGISQARVLEWGATAISYSNNKHQQFKIKIITSVRKWLSSFHTAS